MNLLSFGGLGILCGVPSPMSGLKVFKNNGLGLDLSAKVLYLNGFNRKLLVVKEIAPGIYAGASRF